MSKLYSNIDLFLAWGLEILPQGGFPLKRRMPARFWLYMIVATLLVFSISFCVLQHRYNLNSRQYAELEARHTELYLKLMDLQDEVDYVKTDAYIERAARDDLGLIMPGEVRYVSGN